MQRLGSRRTSVTVERDAHLASDHLLKAANRLDALTGVCHSAAAANERPPIPPSTGLIRFPDHESYGVSPNRPIPGRSAGLIGDAEASATIVDCALELAALRKSAGRKSRTFD
jgi:hypothetical protein